LFAGLALIRINRLLDPWVTVQLCSVTGNAMRLFFGTALPRALSRTLEERSAAFIGASGWRTAVPDNWHVTVLFLGERGADDLGLLKDRAAALARTTAPFTLLGGRLETMPTGIPTMLWVRFAACKAFSAAHEDLRRALGVPPSPHQPVVPHITLTRSRGRPTALTNGPLVVPELVVNELTLFHSVAGEKGRRYVPMATWPLTGTGPAGLVAEG
jgi:2'-5' RNA ligase